MKKRKKSGRKNGRKNERPLTAPTQAPVPAGITVGVTVPSGSSLSVNGNLIVVKGPAGAVAGMFPVGSLFYVGTVNNGASILLSSVYEIYGSTAYLDTGERRVPNPGEFYFLVGSAVPAVWLCPETGLDATAIMPAVQYGILEQATV
jgi:hypothetical protein